MNTTLDPAGFELLTFDCYGTLVDWERGIVDAARPVFQARGRSPSDGELLAGFAEHEHVVQAERYRKYREVLALTIERMADDAGFSPTAHECEAFAGSVGSWPPFPDTVEALRKLGSRYRLGVVSNVDRDLFAATQVALEIDFDWVVTAEDAGGYKPAPDHFDTMRSASGIPAKRTLHIAQSLFHDIAPASALGYATVHVDRRSRGSGGGATPPARVRPTATVQDMAGVVELMGLGDTRSVGVRPCHSAWRSGG
ncbi:MAG: HAD-IA family hydrolase [Gemmatimonadetes bacterium]|nr:HAD-IA family hydrolase [Gemmatimonadota bacterium]